MEDRQALLATIKVTGSSLAQSGGGCPDAQYIVTHLKGHANGLAKRLQTFDGCLVLRSQQSTHFCSTAHQGCCFAADHLQVLRDRDILTCLKTHIQVLALDNGLNRVIKKHTQTRHCCARYTLFQSIPERLAS